MQFLLTRIAPLVVSAFFNVGLARAQRQKGSVT